MIDFVNAERKAVGAVAGNEFTFVRVDLLNKVVKFLEKRRVIEIRADTSDGIAGQPATLVIAVQNFEVAAFDFDDQPKLFGEFELVSIVL